MSPRPERARAACRCRSPRCWRTAARHRTSRRSACCRAPRRGDAAPTRSPRRINDRSPPCNIGSSTRCLYGTPTPSRRAEEHTPALGRRRARLARPRPRARARASRTTWRRPKSRFSMRHTCRRPFFLRAAKPNHVMATAAPASRRAASPHPKGAPARCLVRHIKHVCPCAEDCGPGDKGAPAGALCFRRYGSRYLHVALAMPFSAPNSQTFGTSPGDGRLDHLPWILR